MRKTGYVRLAGAGVSRLGAKGQRDGLIPGSLESPKTLAAKQGKCPCRYRFLQHDIPSIIQKMYGLRKAFQRQMRLSPAGVRWRGPQRHIRLAPVQGSASQGPDCHVKANPLGQPAERALNKPHQPSANSLAPSP